MIKVTATANGYYGSKVRIPGEQFGIEKEEEFSSRWMTKDEQKPEMRRVNTGGTDGVAGAEVPKAGVQLSTGEKVAQANAIAGRSDVTAAEADAILAAVSAVGGSSNDDRTHDFAINQANNAPLPDAADSGKAEAEDEAEAETAVDIPEDWKTLHYTKRVAMAKRISGDDGLTADEANVIIEAEAKKRAARG